MFANSRRDKDDISASSDEEISDKQPQQEQNQQPPQERQELQQPHMEDFYSDDALNPTKVDDLMKKEMMDMSANDRNTISEEIHGVRCLAPTETRGFLEESLRELDAELAEIPAAKKRAFLHALKINTATNTNTNTNTTNTNESGSRKAYVETDEFRLRFLRCELFDAKRAALRLVNYLDLIAYCLPFDTGLMVLQRPITLTDFNEAERTMLRKGQMQLLPFRDRSGRRVLTGVDSLGIRFDPRMWYKILLYFMWSAGEDVESQQKGIVFLLWPNPDIAKSIKLRYPMNSGGRLVQMVFQCVPTRVAAFHFCAPANDPFFSILRSVFALALVGGRRSRLRFHTGGPIELRYQIKSYGIPVDLLPLTSTGNVKTTYHKQWIRLRHIFEEEIKEGGPDTTTTNSSPSLSSVTSTLVPMSISLSPSMGTPTSAHRDTLIECPGSKDVVFRPGKPVMNHPGNVTFRSIIEAKSFQHDMATQTEKAGIAREVADEMIEARGGRFLVWEDSSSSWKAITDPAQQRHKVAIAFRNFKSYRKALGNRQTMTSGKGGLTGGRAARGDCGDASTSAVRAIFEQLNHGTSRQSDSSDDDMSQRKRRKSCF